LHPCNSAVLVAVVIVLALVQLVVWLVGLFPGKWAGGANVGGPMLNGQTSFRFSARTRFIRHLRIRRGETTGRERQDELFPGEVLQTILLQSLCGLKAPNWQCNFINKDSALKSIRTYYFFSDLRTVLRCKKAKHILGIFKMLTFKAV